MQPKSLLQLPRQLFLLLEGGKLVLGASLAICLLILISWAVKACCECGLQKNGNRWHGDNTLPH